MGISFVAFALCLPLLWQAGEVADSSPTKTFRDETHRIELTYPADWTLDETARGVTFRSPHGASIALRWEERSAGAQEMERDMRAPNRKCSSRINSHGSEVVLCVDTASFAYRARVVVSPGSEGESIFVLTAKGGANGPILEGMVDSARPIE